MPYFGNIRSTQDIDIMLLLDDIEEQEIMNWLEDLEERKLVLSKSEILYALNHNIHSNVFDPQTFVFRVDLKPIHTTLDRLSFKYRQQVQINNREVWINCAESQIGVKVSQGFRSTTDLEDVQTIIETMSLDIERLNEFLEATNSYQYFCTLLREFDTRASIDLIQKIGCSIV